MAYTATDVKNLRERTGAGMMDCKKALDETGGDCEAGVDSLKANSLAAMSFWVSSGNCSSCSSARRNCSVI